MKVLSRQGRPSIAYRVDGEGARAQAIAQEHVQVAKLNLEYAFDRPDAVEGVMPAIKLVSSRQEPK